MWFKWEYRRCRANSDTHTYIGSYDSGHLLEVGRAFQVTRAAVVVNLNVSFKMKVSIAVRCMGIQVVTVCCEDFI